LKVLEEQISIIKRGTVEIISEQSLTEKIKKSVKENKPLVVKAGFDPTAPDIHLGHTVLLRKLRHFQECGHKVEFLIGDATALVGDPSGKSQTRKVMTWEEVEANALTYKKQVSKILDTTDPRLFELKYNSKWFSNRGQKEKAATPFTFETFVELAQKYTVARLLERDDFEKRLKENKPISFLELFYPLMQGYDSVMMKADIELGGNDQKFNMLVGRTLQEAYRQEPQVVISMPILEGLDGVNKMSKSLDNYVAINDQPKDMFGKIMSISDAIMLKYYELLTDEPLEQLKNNIQSGKLHPKQAKMNLAKIIIAQYHDEAEADKAEANFEMAFKEKKFPDNIPLMKINVGTNDHSPLQDKNGIKTIDAITALSLVTKESKGEIKRKIKEGAVEIDEAKLDKFDFNFTVSREYKIRIGKRFFKALFEL